MNHFLYGLTASPQGCVAARSGRGGGWTVRRMCGAPEPLR